MGIRNFFKFVEKYCPDIIERKKLGDYSGKLLGIDANFLLYKLLEQNMIFLCNNDIQDTNNYEMFFFKLTNIISYIYCFGIKLIFIFDGKVPEIKRNTVNERRFEREKAYNELENIIDELEELESDEDEVDPFQSFINDCKREDNETLSKEELLKKRKKLLLDSIYLDSNLIKSVKEFLTYCGVPYLDAPYEADSQLAYMSKNNLIDGVISNDYDILTFGAKKIIINVFLNTRLDIIKEVYEIQLDKLLKKIKLNYNTFVELCILMGSDYSEKPNYTFEYLYELILNKGSYENIKDMLDLPTNLNMENIKNYFFECYSTTFDYSTFIQTYKFFNYNLDKMSIFLNSKKNIFLNDTKIGKFMNNIKKSEFKKK